jgi:PHD/YefM family antitoxin component YafN of YafNO toxin-antitoxin module
VAIAIGNGHQRILIDKNNGMVVVITAGNYNNWTLTNNSDKLATDFIYAAIK